MGYEPVVNVSQIANAVIKALDEFKDVTADVVDNAVEKTAQETAKDITALATAKFKTKHNYAYAKSWSYKKSIVKGQSQAIVYARKPYYMIAHFLEKGHANRDGGRTKTEGRPHISEAESRVESRIIAHIREGLNQ